jgi:hypothetical protein
MEGSTRRSASARESRGKGSETHRNETGRLAQFKLKPYLLWPMAALRQKLIRGSASCQRVFASGRDCILELAYSAVASLCIYVSLLATWLQI